MVSREELVRVAEHCSEFNSWFSGSAVNQVGPAPRSCENCIHFDDGRCEIYQENKDREMHM